MKIGRGSSDDGRLLVTGLIAARRSTTAHAAAVGVAAVDIKEFAYTPPTLAVPVGTTVHVDEPRRGAAHRSPRSTGAFGSAGLDTDETFAHTFTQPGTYEYFCALHPLMTAVVVVK